MGHSEIAGVPGSLGNDDHDCQKGHHECQKNCLPAHALIRWFLNYV
jgi:hypothetical protein